MTARTSKPRSIFHLVLIKPSRYDDSGYVIQWVRSMIPSNSLAAIYGLALDCARRQVLGKNIEIKITAIDETNTRVNFRRLTRDLKRPAVKSMIGMVGVQTNQFPRAVDIARRFRAAGLQVCIGGFHVSGSMAMLPEMPTELKEALDLGISLFAGEAEGRLEQVLRDAYSGELQPVYNFLAQLPDLEGAPTPYLPPEYIMRNAAKETTFDAGRGCPFFCSFCTIINVQGRKSRYRSADDVEKIVRANHANGIRHYFITDDNFSRNRHWEMILDRLIKLREDDFIPVKVIIQVDTMCHKSPGFVEKAARAGVNKVFIGLESINPDSLAGAGKKHNRIDEYRRMLEAWHDVGVVTFAGYIIGFPNDTKESILADIELIQRQLPIVTLEFFTLTPLPGSEHHKQMLEAGDWMEPDLNNYDLNHVTANHPKMSKKQWQEAYDLAWHRYYTLDHFSVLLRRARSSDIPSKRIERMTLGFYACYALEGVHPLEGGVFRRKYRHDRRPGLSLENRFVFYPKYLGEQLAKITRFGVLYWKYRRIRRTEEIEHRK